MKSPAAISKTLHPASTTIPVRAVVLPRPFRMFMGLVYLSGLRRAMMLMLLSGAGKSKTPRLNAMPVSKVGTLR